MEQIYFVLTERCNLSCSHCIRDSSPYKSESSELALIKQTLSEISSFSPESLVLLSGGEPTLYKGFVDVLDHAMSLNLSLNINSNGTTKFFLTQQGVDLLTNYPFVNVQISLDGSKLIHDKIRGEGAFDRALHTVKKLRFQNIRCSVSTTVTDNYFFSSVKEFLQSVDTLGLTHVAIKRATYAGRASDNITLQTADWNRQVQELRKIPLNTPLKIHPMYDFSWLEQLDDTVLNQIHLPASARNCGAGISKIYIYPDGSVCSCTCFRNVPMGNLKEESLQAILRKPPIFNITNNTCRSCRYFKLCNGGCLGSGYGATGVLNTPDPRCPKHEKTIPTLNV